MREKKRLCIVMFGLASRSPLSGAKDEMMHCLPRLSILELSLRLSTPFSQSLLPSPRACDLISL